MSDTQCKDFPTNYTFASDLLDRYRENVLFYLKLDLAVMAALAGLASVLKLEGRELIVVLANYSSAIVTLGFLVIYALIFELLITTCRDIPPWATETKARLRNTFARIVSPFYAIQVFVHIVMLGYVTGYVKGALNCVGGCS